MADKRFDCLMIEAYRVMNSGGHRASTEDITCNPQIRSTFMNVVNAVAGEDVKEEKALRRLSALRKQKLLPLFAKKRSES